MQAITNPRTSINPSTIYNLRQSGASLQQIAGKIGRTKERVRQILLENYGSTKHKLVSTRQLCRLSGFTKNQVVDLYQDGVIIPMAECNTRNRHYLLWSLATVEQVTSYYKTHRLCKMCHRPIPKGRRNYCSEQCYKEGHKYKYRSIEAKQRHLRNIKRYRERRKQLARATVIGNPKYQPEPLVVSEIAMLPLNSQFG